MDDDKSRSYRDRDPVAREAPEQFSRGALRDLLVELARLTGQGDPNVSRDGGSSGLDWAADDAAPEQHQLGKKHHVPEPSARSSRLRPAEMIGGQFFAASTDIVAHRVRRSPRRRYPAGQGPGPAKWSGHGDRCAGLGRTGGGRCICQSRRVRRAWTGVAPESRE